MSHGLLNASYRSVLTLFLSTTAQAAAVGNRGQNTPATQRTTGPLRTPRGQTAAQSSESRNRGTAAAPRAQANTEPTRANRNHPTPAPAPGGGGGGGAGGPAAAVEDVVRIPRPSGQPGKDWSIAVEMGLAGATKKRLRYNQIGVSHHSYM